MFLHNYFVSFLCSFLFVPKSTNCKLNIKCHVLRIPIRRPKLSRQRGSFHMDTESKSSPVSDKGKENEIILVARVETPRLIVFLFLTLTTYYFVSLVMNKNKSIHLCIVPFQIPNSHLKMSTILLPLPTPEQITKQWIFGNGQESGPCNLFGWYVICSLLCNLLFLALLSFFACALFS